MKEKPPLEDYISLKEASKISGYHPDYLGYLVRKGKIEGKKIGRDWFITKSALQNYLLGKKFFSLREILFSKISFQKILFFAIAGTIILVAGFFIFTPPSFQEIKGDFASQKLQPKSIGPLEVTGYLLENSGEIEISIKPPLEPSAERKETPFLQKIKNFFNSYVPFK